MRAQQPIAPAPEDREDVRDSAGQVAANSTSTASTTSDPLFILTEVQKALGEWETDGNPVRRLMVEAWREHPELVSWLLQRANQRGHNYSQELITVRRHQILRQLKATLSIEEMHKALEGKRPLTAVQRSLVDEFLLLKPHIPAVNTIRKILAQKVA